MKRQARWLVLLIALLVISGLACDGLIGVQREEGRPALSEAEGGAGEQGRTDHELDAAETSTEELAAAGELLNLNRVSEGLGNLNSYRLQMSVYFTVTEADGSATNRKITTEAAYVAQPPARSLTMHVEGVAAGPATESLAFVHIGDTAFAVMPDLGCFSGSSADVGHFEESFATLASPDAFVGNLQGAQRVLPDEVVNGIPVRHYVFNETALRGTQGNWTNVDGHIYVAIEGDYVVRLRMEGDGAVNLLNQDASQGGAVQVTYDLLDVNQPIEIAPPAECDDPDAANTYPLLDDAYEKVSFQDLVSYKTQLSFDEVVAFYQREMAQAGWQLQEDALVLEGTAFLSFSKDNLRVSVTISQEGNAVVVLITSQ